MLIMVKKDKIETNTDIQNTLASNIVLFNLNLRASNIKNVYSVRNSVNALVEFINSDALYIINP